MATKTLISVEEFAQMPRDEAVDYELVEGELIPLPSATPRHSLVRDQLGDLLRSFVRKHSLGAVVAEVDCTTIGHTVRRPDLSFFTTARWRRIDTDKIPIPGAPDIAVEVLSPSEAAIAVHGKMAEYFASGSDEVWLIDVTNSEIQICRPAAIRRLRSGDTLESEILPGFAVPVDDVLAAR